MEIIRGRQYEKDPLPEPLPGTLLRIAEIPSKFPGGQTVVERVKAILDAAGYGPPPPVPPVEACDFRINVDGEPVFICTEARHPDAPHLHAMLDGHTGELVRCKHYGREGR